MIESDEDFARRLSYVSGVIITTPHYALEKIAQRYGLTRHVVYLPAVSCRFYWEDGRMTWESVLPERDDSMPRSWKIRKIMQPRVVSFDPDVALEIPRGQFHIFESREYHYPEDFIGPHQALEYHARTVPETFRSISPADAHGTQGYRS